MKKKPSILEFPLFLTFFLSIILSAMPLAANADTIITDFEEFTPPTFNSLVMFRQPSFSGSTSTMLESTPDLSHIVQPLGGIGGNTTKILETSFAWKSAVSNPWLRLTTFDLPGAPIRPLSNPQVDLSQRFFFDIYSVDFINLYGVGIRETNTSGPIGSDGGVSGTIEWVSNAPLGAWPSPITGGMLITPNQWHTIGIDLVALPYIRAFTGNGSLTGSFGVLESLVFTPYNGVLGTSTNSHSIYLDNFRQAAVPEPSTLLLLGSGLAALVAVRRFRK